MNVLTKIVVCVCVFVLHKVPGMCFFSIQEVVQYHYMISLTVMRMYKLHTLDTKWNTHSWPDSLNFVFLLLDRWRRRFTFCNINNIAHHVSLAPPDKNPPLQVTSLLCHCHTHTHARAQGSVTVTQISRTWKDSYLWLLLKTCLWRSISFKTL